jgi:prophage regulatory protein
MSDALLTLPQVLAKVGMKRATVYAAIARGEFPQQVKLGRSSRWSCAELDAWLEAKKANRTPPKLAA